MVVAYQRPATLNTPGTRPVAANQISPARYQSGPFTRSVSGGERFTDTRVSPNQSIYNPKVSPIKPGGVSGTPATYRNTPITGPNLSASQQRAFPGFNNKLPTWADPKVPSGINQPPSPKPTPISSVPAPATRGIPLSNLASLGIGSALAGGLDVASRLQQGESLAGALTGGTATGLGSLGGGLLGSGLGPAGTIAGSFLGGLLGKGIGDLINALAGLNSRQPRSEQTGPDYNNQQAGQRYDFDDYIEVGWAESSNNLPSSRIAKGFSFVAEPACSEGYELHVYGRLGGLPDGYATCLAPGKAIVSPYAGQPVTPVQVPKTEASATPALAPPLIYTPGLLPQSIPRATPGGAPETPPLPTLPQPQPSPQRQLQPTADPRVEADPLASPQLPLFPPLVLPPLGSPNPGTPPGQIVLPPGQGILPVNPKSPECVDPCELATFDALDSIRQWLENLLPQTDGQGEPVPDEENPFERILKELAEIKDSVNAISDRLDAVEEKLEEQAQWGERTYKIVGGDRWFTQSTTEPQLTEAFETGLKNSGSEWGFTAESESAATADNLLDLIRLYQSVVYNRAGLYGFPATVPRNLLSQFDQEEPISVPSYGSLFFWFLTQFDTLIGEWPIKITVEDIDPLQPGEQTKEIELTNIAEALAEMYALDLSSSTNAGLSINFLMRLAAETIAIKNSSIVIQDYVKANASWMGYKGNPARREIDYNFDPSKLDSLDAFLNETKGYVVGWEENDKESLVAFLQRLMFAAGIIKAVFFRGQGRLNRTINELINTGDESNFYDDIGWDELIALINDPNSAFNKDSVPKPGIDKKPNPTAPPPEEEGN